MTLPSQQTESKSTLVANAISKVVDSFAARFRKQGIACDLQIGSCCEPELSGAEMVSVLTELTSDACKAMGEGGELSVTMVDFSEHVEIEVADSRLESTLRRTDLASDARLRFPICRALGLTVESLPCPQGGLARTVRIHRRAHSHTMNRAA